MPFEAPPSAGLDRLLSPRSVAIVGASSNPMRFGGKPIQYLRQSGFSGGIYPVNPTRSEIQGLPCFASVADVPGPVDCAILAVGPEDTLAAVEQCAERGVGAAILYSAGFSETGEEGRARQAQLVETARAGGVRLLGPNCMGAFNANAGFYGTFASALEEGLPPAGRIGLVSQSGGYGGYVLKHFFLRGLGLSCWATTGNEADIEAGELLGWMAARDDTDVLVGYLEGVRSRDNLIGALDTARRNNKPVVMMKVGRTAEGAAAAASHTASLTGEDAVYDALFEAYGVHRARTTDELLDVAYALSKRQLPKGRRVGVISISGGVGVQIADYISDAGLELGVVPEDTQAALRAIVPNCSPRNPIDMTGLVTTDAHIMRETADLALASGAFDALVVFIGIAGAAPSMAGPLQEALSEASAQHPGRLILVSVTSSPEMVRAYDQRGFLVFEDPARAITALAALSRFSELADAPAPAPPQPWTDVVDWPTDNRFNEARAKALVAACGVRAPRETLVTTPEAARAAAAEIGGSVAVKVVSADILHKTEVGGVALGLPTPQAAADAVAQMQVRLPETAPEARIDGFLVSEMVAGGVECIIGVHQDAALGPVVTFGLGGVLVELLRDTACRLAPVSVAEAGRMMRELKSWPLLDGYRGGPSYDTEALAQAISAVSRLAATHGDRIAAIEINPVRVLECGHGLVALDAVVQTQG